MRDRRSENDRERKESSADMKEGGGQPLQYTNSSVRQLPLCLLLFLSPRRGAS